MGDMADDMVDRALMQAMEFPTRRRMMEIKFDEFLHETDKAYLLRFGDSEEWLPKSQVETMDMDDSIVEVADWLVEKRGLECYET